MPSRRSPCLRLRGFSVMFILLAVGLLPRLRAEERRQSIRELLQQANGRVWELTVPSREAEAWQARMTVANLRYDGNSVTLRILADAKPAPAARPCIPTLEDLYLLYFPEEEGGDNP